MKREKKNPKKQPSDYPIFAFRLPDADHKSRLMDEIDEVKRFLNATKKENEKVINKNDIILEALKIGLNVLKK